MDIGKRIKEVRNEKGFTQQGLAKSIGLSRSYLSDLENNRKSPSIRTVEKIADKLNMTLCELLCK